MTFSRLLPEFDASCSLPRNYSRLPHYNFHKLIAFCKVDSLWLKKMRLNWSSPIVHCIVQIDSKYLEQCDYIFWGFVPDKS